MASSTFEVFNLASGALVGSVGRQSRSTTERMGLKVLRECTHCIHIPVLERALIFIDWKTFVFGWCALTYRLPRGRNLVDHFDQYSRLEDEFFIGDILLPPSSCPDISSTSLIAFRVVLDQTRRCWLLSLSQQRQLLILATNVTDPHLEKDRKTYYKR